MEPQTSERYWRLQGSIVAVLEELPDGGDEEDEAWRSSSTSSRHSPHISTKTCSSSIGAINHRISRGHWQV